MKALARVLLLTALVVWGWPATTREAGAASDDALWQAAGVTRAAQPAPAPPVVLTDLGGQKLDLAELRGRLVMLYFWATW